MKIPSQAKRVFKGVIFDVYQWEQEMYDGSKATFEALKRPNTILTIPIKGNKLLLSFEEQPGKPRRYGFIGGRAEPNELPLDTAKRELLEETGMESADWELFGSYEFDGKIEWTTHLFIARNCQKIAEQKLDAGEKIDVYKCQLSEFMEKIRENERTIFNWIQDDYDRFTSLLSLK